MLVHVNGQAADVPEATTGAELLAAYSLQPVALVVELNGSVTPLRDFLRYRLRDSDAVEIVTVVGGG